MGTPGHWCQLAFEALPGGILVGDLAAKVGASEPREMEVGFTLAPAHQGQGYGTEALRGLLDVAFGTLGLHRVIAVTDALDAPAAALLEGSACGVRRTSTRTSSSRAPGEASSSSRCSRTSGGVLIATGRRRRACICATRTATG